MTNITLSTRFWSKVDQRGPDECWPWTAAMLRGGYGMFFDGTKNRGAHVIAYELAHGSLPVGKPQVNHSCDNRACCNVRHLVAGTQAENMADMVAKGRQAQGDSFAARPILRGERHGCSKLVDADIHAIRQQSATGATQTALAHDFGVSISQMNHIVNRQSWSHI